MAIDYSKLRPSDFRPERDSEFRAETNFLQRQEDRSTRLQKEEGQAQVEAEEPLAKFEQELAKTIERNRKNAESAEDRQLRLTRQQQADIDKETSKFVATTTREDRATTQANQKAESRLAALGKPGEAVWYSIRLKRPNSITAVRILTLLTMCQEARKLSATRLLPWACPWLIRLPFPSLSRPGQPSNGETN